MIIAIEQLTPSPALLEVDSSVKNKIVGGGFELPGFNLDNFDVVLDGGSSSRNVVLNNSASGVSRVAFFGNSAGEVTSSVTTSVTDGFSTVSSVSISGNIQ